MKLFQNRLFVIVMVCMGTAGFSYTLTQFPPLDRWKLLPQQPASNTASQSRTSIHSTENSGEASLSRNTVSKKVWLENANIVLPGASLHIPAGAMISPAVVSVSGLQEEEVPRLDQGLINVTDVHKGFRFLPHGSHFKKPLTLTIGYDDSRIPKGYSADDIRTFFFDEKAGYWVALPKDSVDMEKHLVISTTTHFTDMINGILEAPEAPATLATPPTAISGIQYPDASSQIAMIAPPTANSSGSAALSYPITLPAGRNGMQPDFSVQYNSGGSDGWLGLGWDLGSSAISIETRWGVPRYDPTVETETYTLEGAQLSPVAHRATAVPRTGEKQFFPRVNNDFQKIIRHGGNPSTYWWEVTEKNGTRKFYGGNPASGVDINAILTDGSGNIAYWALTETRDANNNFVRFRYTKVSDAGMPGPVINDGINIYPASVTYTGHGNTEGKYTVLFTRDRELSEPKRKDVSISGRLGFKQVTADLLRKIVIQYNGQPVRSYELTYVEGKFFRTLLQNIKQFDASGALFTTHTFDYYNDVELNGQFKPLTAEESWDPGTDNVSGTFLNPIPGFQDAASSLSGTKSIGGGFDMAVTIGPDDEELHSKSNTAGVTFGFSVATNEGMLALVDINGDGLADKVFKNANGLHYRANQSGTSSKVIFSDPLPISGIGDFSQGLNWGVKVGLESNFFIYAGLGYAHSEDITNVYLTDVNGDGLVDIVNNGTVFFNHLDNNGNPTFTASSGDTPSPINASSGIDGSVVDNDPAVLEKAIDDNPLHDVVKVWVAPFDGTVSINAPVALFQLANSQSNTAADGVRVAIQVKGTELWSANIGANDFTPKIPTGVGLIPVKAGDRIYFRVQSIFNGASDQVHWTPQITYSTNLPALTDANALPVYQFQSDKDFLMSAPLSVGMPLDGTIHIQGNFTKPVTSDDLVITIIRENNGVRTTILDEHLAWDQAITIPVSIDQKVAKDDNLFFRVTSESNVDWTSLTWNPSVYYTASDDPKVPEVVNSKGEALIKIAPTIDFKAFTKTVIPSLPWTAPSKKTFSIQAKPKLNPSLESGMIYFSVKKENELIAKQVIPVTNGALSTPAPISASFNEGDKVFFEYHTDSFKIAGAFDSTTVIIDASSGKPDTLLGALHTVDTSFIFGPLYRHWGQFGYNGNRSRADQPINEADLKLNPVLLDKTPEKIDFGPLVDTTNPTASMQQMEQLYDSKSGYQPKDDKFIYLAPNSGRKAWIGYDDLTFVTRDTISSSRMGRDDILPINPVVVSNAGGSGAVGIKKVAQTDDFSLGVSAPGGQLGFGFSIGSTKFAYDYSDMNGDGYPDILSSSKIQYTNPYGGLEPVAKPFSFGDVTFSNHKAVGVNAGGSLELSTSPNSSKSSGGGNANAASQESKGSVGISGSIGVNWDNETVAFMDVNGDGLPDRVHDNGEVELNIGYSFLKPEQWGYEGLSDGKALNEGGGISINIDNHSITAGISLSRSDNVTEKTLLDVNGDGLLDYIQGVDPLVVQLNMGNGFGQAITWNGARYVNTGTSTGESLNIGFTVGISIIPILPIIKLCFNPQVTVSQGANQTGVQFGDIDGDGFPDYLQSDVDNKLTVSRSTIRRTNLLKKVTRPMGGSFVMDYQRIGNTYDMPNSVWALSRVDLYDGLAGDGPEHTSSAFAYGSGKYDRNEREFYGFGQVVTRDLDTDNKDAVYRMREDDYFTDNFYNKGILKSTVLEDASGNKFTEEINSIELKDISTGSTLPGAFAQTDDGAAFPALIKTEKLFYQGQPTAGKSTSTTYAYDPLGNLARTTDFGDPGDDDDVSTFTSYHSVPGKYIMSIPSSVTVSGNGTTYRQRSSDIDNNTGNITQTRQFLASGEVAKFDMTYDVYGNMTSITRPENANGQRLAYNYEYDGDVQTYVTKTSDSYGYSSSATYDVRFGQQLSSTDLNGQQTQYTLDAAGRLATIRGPLEIASGQPFTIAFEYHPDDPTSWAMAKHYDPAHPGNYLETASFRDGIGREVQTKKDIGLFIGAKAADDEVMVVSGSTVFDAFFRPVKQWYPLTEPKGTIGIYNTGSDVVTPEGMTYDVMDRMLTDTLPDGVYRKMVYGFGNDRNGAMQFKTTSSDANGISTESYLNVRDLLKATRRQYSQGSDVWTSYEFNPVNEMTKAIDDMGNVIEMAYDQFGRKASDIHPDAGTTTYKYDLAGNLVEKKTANLQGNGSGITYTYDRERLTKITYPQNAKNNVSYTYGAPGAAFYRAGRVVNQQDASGTQEFFYNPLGATVKNVRVVNVPDKTALTYTTQWTYDTWNRLTGMIYPDGEVLTYNYNVGGQVQNMSGIQDGVTRNYVTQLGYSKFEGKVYSSFGNGTEMTYTFGPERRELAKMTAKTSAGRFMMDNTYTWDNEDEILKIVNAAPVPPSNLMGGSSSYQYNYDDLYRITSSSGLFSDNNHQNRFTQEMTYNSVSSILSKTQLHERKGYDETDWTKQNQTTYSNTYDYNSAGVQPHSPIHIGTDAYTYDANGNQLTWQNDVSAQNREITWDEENRMQALSDNGQLFNYTYDADGMRVLKSNGNGQTVSINGKKAAQTSGTGNYVIYVNPYEVVRSADYTKHYYISGERIASVLGITGKKTSSFEYYYHPDHLGNSAFVTDASGEVFQHLEYFPFGETFIEEHSNQQRTPYLYNGKELDDEVALYYYGARYYDPVTSIWENVDPSWDKPDQIEISPYAYVGNNPITYVDPDGRFKLAGNLIQGSQRQFAGLLANSLANRGIRPTTLTAANNSNPVQALAISNNALAANARDANAAANNGNKGGDQYHLSGSILGIKVFNTGPDKRTWLQKQRDTYKKIGQKWEKAKMTSVSTFVKLLRARNQRSLR